jgi:hypothetical protein
MRRAQFSIRGVFLLVAVIALWLGWTVETARRRNQAIDQIVQAGGTVEFATERPSWLWRLTKNDGFARVSTTKLSGPQFTDESLPVLAELPDATFLEICNSPVYQRSAGEIRYSGFPPSVELGDDGKGITDAALTVVRLLPALPALETIRLRAPLVTDEGLKSLSRCPRLSYLFLDCRRVTDRGLGYLQQAARLTHLILWSGQVTEAAANEFKRVMPGYRVDRWPSS